MNGLSRRSLLGVFGALAFSCPARAGETALKIVYPYPAGGSGDAVVRIIADQLQTSLGRPVVVENRTGASGRIGTRVVRDAAPDGNTLLFVPSGPMTFLPHLVGDLGYDPFADFAPVGQVASTEISLAVSGQLQVRSLQDLAAWLQANPDKATYATPGTGSSAHFVGAEFARRFGLKLQHVAYRGAPAALPDVLSNRVPIVLALTGELLPHHNAGGIVILATAAANRSALVPDVSTFKESGLDIEADNWLGFFVPARTPQHAVDRLEAEILAAARMPAVKNKILAQGLYPTTSTSVELARLQRTQYDRSGAAIRAAAFKLE